MRLALAPWGESLEEMVGAARAAEAGGFESIWTSELHRSAFVPASALATATSQIRVGTAAALAFVRSPMTTAMEAMDVDELSNGRFVLGLGPGVRRLNEEWHSVPFERPARRMRETVEIVRRFIADSHRGVEISYEGEIHRVRVRGYQRPFTPVRASIPIYLASVGPVLTRLAGEIGNGWIAHELGSPVDLDKRVLPELESGLKRGGRERGDLIVMASAVCVPHPDAVEARRRAAGLVAFYATVRTYSDFFESLGFGREANEIQRLFREGDIERTINGATEEMVEALTITGSADEVRKKLERYEGIADVVKLSPPTHFVPAEVTREAQKGILEMFSK